MEKADGSHGVHLEHVFHVVDVKRLDGAEATRDAGIGDNEVELGDTMLGSEGIHGCSCVAGGRALDLDEDEITAFGLAELQEGLGSFRGGVADAADDDMVWAGEITS